MQRICILIYLSLIGFHSIFAEEIDFDTDIVPLLSKTGCNAASCHGSSAGQADFRLSLFGGDPGFDHRSIVHELEGRRLNYVHPNESLLLAKPTGQLEHGGGEVIDDQAASVISRWIQAGATRKNRRRIERLIVTPTSIAVAELPAKFHIEVSAVFSDGRQRDVTATAVYESQNKAALSVADDGVATVLRAGQHAVTVRFCDQVTAVLVTSPFGSDVPTIPASARRNWIDDEINARLIALGIPPKSPCTDLEWVRRVTVDLTGRLPSLDLVQSLGSESRGFDRSELIGQLLASDEFTDYWTHRLASQLQLRKPGIDSMAATVFYRWLREQVAADARWDSIAESLVLSQGDSHVVGPATVHRYFATAREEAEYMSEVLMGVRLRCANCHNHPLDRWTQDDYHGLAAIFVGLERGRVVNFTGRGEVTHPRTGKPAVAKIPGQDFLGQDPLGRELDSRQVFANWLTSADNPHFARAMVGRVWAALMGRGLVNPVDDLRATNPPTHPELLDRLSEYFVANDYRLRPLIRLICESAAYQRAGHPPTGTSNGEGQVDDRFYSHALIKPFSAEVLADAISDVTGVPDDYDGIDRAINVVDRTVSATKLEFLGQCLPGEACSVGDAQQGTSRGIASQLHLLNGSLMNEKIRSPDGRLHSLIQQGTSIGQIVQTLFLASLGRPPSQSERTDWEDRLGGIEDVTDSQARNARLEDFLWALLNCHEFSTNH